MKIEVSNGEIVDKMTILEIKLHEMKDAEKLKKVQTEYDILKQSFQKIISKDHELYKELYDINSKLWKIEDDIRDCERSKDFSQKFIELARSVYFINDERARVKLAINKVTGSEIEEVKSYAQYA